MDAGRAPARGAHGARRPAGLCHAASRDRAARDEQRTGQHRGRRLAPGPYAVRDAAQRRGAARTGAGDCSRRAAHLRSGLHQQALHRRAARAGRGARRPVARRHGGPAAGRPGHAAAGHRGHHVAPAGHARRLPARHAAGRVADGRWQPLRAPRPRAIAHRPVDAEARPQAALQRPLQQPPAGPARPAARRPLRQARWA